MRTQYYTALYGILALLLAVWAPVQAQTADPGYLVYVDSVEAGPGSDVAVRFYLSNQQALTSLSVPIEYDPTLVALKSISFTDSKAQHIANKVVTPTDPSRADGHFLVAAFQWLEDPIPAGDGLLFTALFQIGAEATVGEFTLLDTLFYPPFGTLELVRADTAGGILPEFEAGMIVVGERNRKPVFATLRTQYVLEGDSLDLLITATDPDQDDLTLAVTTKPVGASFVDNGDGTARFVWVPDFVGPYSSDGSPLTLGFWAGDGDLSSQLGVTVNVLNRNRKPEISAPESASVEAGETLRLEVSAFDPDFEAVTWSWSGLPQGASFNAHNPGEVIWSSSVVDTGSFEIEFIAADPQGLADTVQIITSVRAIALYTLSIDSVQAFSGETVEFSLQLDNKLPVSSFDILFSHDPIALTLLSLTNTGSRSEFFEYFNVVTDAGGMAGHVRIVGVTEVGGGAPALAAGDGPIAVGNLRISGNLAYAGMSVPMFFRFLDAPLNDDNTLTDGAGDKIEQGEIEYVNGAVQIQDLGQIRIGDINLNGIAAEIGDVIYFTNYFINPELYKFNALQYANSDVNQDGFVATVSDLVALINRVVSGGSSSAKTGGDDNLTATIEAETGAGGTVFSYDCPVEAGGAYLIFETNETISESMVSSSWDNMSLDFRQDGSRVKVLLYSLDGESMPAGRTPMFEVAGLRAFELTHLELGSYDGRLIPVTQASREVGLPTSYTLMQNYPNPFNPETSIEFALPQAARVELTIYNVIGRRVTTLVEGEYPAGVHEVRWDGTDGSGRAVASGVYLYRLVSGGDSITRKMMLLK